MPALFTHHLFGERSLEELPEGLITTEEERLAFLLGNQGPDPFFFRYLGLPQVIKPAIQLGKRMHHEKPLQAFQCLRAGVSRLPKEDQALGRAFALGVLSHYALDRATHPFIFAEQDALIDASNGELEGAGSQVHAVIEGRIDSYLLKKWRGGTIEDFPAPEELIRSSRTDTVAGALMADVAHTVFDLPVDATQYGKAVNNMQLAYTLIEPAGAPVAQGLATTERAVRHAPSLLGALGHEVDGEACAKHMNLDHQAWYDPATGREMHDSFLDRFDAALTGWPALAQAFVTSEGLEEQVKNINYSGTQAPV
jgi:hypothetical protein